MSSQSVQETIPFSNLNPWNRTVLAPNIRKIWSIRESSSPHRDTLIHIHSQFSYNNLHECPQATAEKLNEKWKTNVTQLWQPSHKSRLPSLPVGCLLFFVTLFLGKLDHVVNPQDCNGSLRGKLQQDGKRWWDRTRTSQIPWRERNKRTNLNNLYFAHRWLYHAILKVVANDTFREVQTHTAQQGSKLNGNPSTGSRSKSHLEPFRACSVSPKTEGLSLGINWTRLGKRIIPGF